MHIQMSHKKHYGMQFLFNCIMAPIFSKLSTSDSSQFLQEKYVAVFPTKTVYKYVFLQTISSQNDWKSVDVEE